MLPDIERYWHHVDHLDMADADKHDLINIVFKAMQSHVDRAFGVDPVQVALGKNHADCARASEDVIDLSKDEYCASDLSKTFNDKKGTNAPLAKQNLYRRSSTAAYRQKNRPKKDMGLRAKKAAAEIMPWRKAIRWRPSSRMTSQAASISWNALGCARCSASSTRSRIRHSRRVRPWTISLAIMES